MIPENIPMEEFTKASRVSAVSAILDGYVKLVGTKPLHTVLTSIDDSFAIQELILESIDAISACRDGVEARDEFGRAFVMCFMFGAYLSYLGRIDLSGVDGPVQ